MTTETAQLVSGFIESGVTGVLVFFLWRGLVILEGRQSRCDDMLEKLVDKVLQQQNGSTTDTQEVTD